MTTSATRSIAYAASFAAALIGCIPEDEICGPYMHYESSLGVCACDDEAIVIDGGCAPRTEPPPSSTCDANLACTDATRNFCAIRDGIGSCTSECTTDTDCPATEVCADWEATPSCRTFSGYGATCVDSSECAGYDADFCIQGFCVVNGCTVGTDDCPRDTACCDFSAYGLGTMCVPAESCPS